MFKELNNLKLFFEEPARQYHLRELARVMKRNPVTVKSYLQDAVKMGILNRASERGLELYSSNTENSYYKLYKKCYNKFKIMESGFIDFLNDELNLPAIILFGSYGCGEDNQNSDADIFILTNTKKDLNLGIFEKKINRPIQLHCMNKAEFDKTKKNNPALINSIINGELLSGYLEAF